MSPPQITARGAAALSMDGNVGHDRKTTMVASTGTFHQQGEMAQSQVVLATPDCTTTSPAVGSRLDDRKQARCPTTMVANGGPQSRKRQKATSICATLSAPPTAGCTLAVVLQCPASAVHKKEDSTDPQSRNAASLEPHCCQTPANGSHITVLQSARDPASPECHTTHRQATSNDVTAQEAQRREACVCCLGAHVCPAAI